jgi:nitrate reductase NapAB chaperone NapD
MIITGSALFIEPDTHKQVIEKLREFPEVTFQAKSESGTELVVNLEAEDQGALERVCDALKERIPEIIDVTHIYVNFEEEVEKMTGRRTHEDPL